MVEAGVGEDKVKWVRVAWYCWPVTCLKWRKPSLTPHWSGRPSEDVRVPQKMLPRVQVVVQLPVSPVRYRVLMCLSMAVNFCISWCEAPGLVTPCAGASCCCTKPVWVVLVISLWDRDSEKFNFFFRRRVYHTSIKSNTVGWQILFFKLVGLL